MLRPENQWPLIRRAFERRQSQVVADRIDPSEFRGKPGFRSDRINSDLKNIERLEAQNEEDDVNEPFRVQYRNERSKQRADVVEAIMYDSARELFGKDAEIVLTSEFDDRVNGLDLLVVFRDNASGERRILGLDFTSAHDDKTIEKKLVRSLRGLARGKLSTATYIKSRDKQDADEYFSANGIPRVVIGVSPLSTLRLAKKWLGEERTMFDPERKVAMLYAVLEQLRSQLLISREQDKAEGKVSFATRQLQQVYDRIDEVIHKIGLPAKEQKADKTLTRIRDNARSRVIMRGLFTVAQRDVKRLDAK